MSIFRTTWIGTLALLALVLGSVFPANASLLICLCDLDCQACSPVAEASCCAEAGPSCCDAKPSCCDAKPTCCDAKPSCCGDLPCENAMFEMATHDLAVPVSEAQTSLPGPSLLLTLEHAANYGAADHLPKQAIDDRPPPDWLCAVQHQVLRT